jgi:hypothetical protein
MGMDLSHGPREVWRRGDVWTAEEIHDAVKEFKPRFLILPPDFPVDVIRVLFLTDPVISRWPRYPRILFRGPHTNTFFVAAFLYTAGTPERWQQILENLRSTSERGDLVVVEAIEGALGDIGDLDPDSEAGVALADPEDWQERVENAEQRLASEGH